MKAYWLKKEEKVRLRSDWTQIDFEVHKREIRLNKTRVFLAWPIIGANQTLYLSEADVEETLKPILSPQTFPSKPKLYRIVIDPGHGGKDPGTQNTKLELREKSLVLDLSQRLKNKLQAMGYSVILTRTQDQFIKLTDRANFANHNNADLFLSIHFNATGNPKVEGIETYAFTPYNQPSTSRASLVSSDQQKYNGNQSDPWNVLLGYLIQKELIEKTRGEDRGLKRARFNVLRDIKMPGVLIEGGFVTHPREAKNIGSAAYREKLADAIVSGVLNYQKTLNRIRKD